MGIGDCRMVNDVMPSGTSTWKTKFPAKEGKGITPPLAKMSSSVTVGSGKKPGDGSKKKSESKSGASKSSPSSASDLTKPAPLPKPS